MAGIFDSWITVGITTGDSTSAMGSTGFQWDLWTATGLNTITTAPYSGPTQTLARPTSSRAARSASARRRHAWSTAQRDDATLDLLEEEEQH